MEDGGVHYEMCDRQVEVCKEAGHSLSYCEIHIGLILREDETE